MENLGIIIAAGGSSQRYGERDKLLEDLCGLPLFLHCVRTFFPLASPGNFIVAVRESALVEYRRLAEKFLPHTSIVWVCGGATRCLSVRNALAALTLKEGIVAIHDAARPLASAELLLKLVEKAKKIGGAIAASKVVDSLKRDDGNGNIAEPVPRENLWRAETPQVFDLRRFREAMEKITDAPTDDAEIARRSGIPVALIESGELNFKLTLPDDLAKFRKILSLKMTAK